MYIEKQFDKKCNLLYYFYKSYKNFRNALYIVIVKAYYNVIFIYRCEIRIVHDLMILSGRLSFKGILLLSFFILYRLFLLHGGIGGG